MKDLTPAESVAGSSNHQLEIAKESCLQRIARLANMAEVKWREHLKTHPKGRKESQITREIEMSDPEMTLLVNILTDKSVRRGRRRRALNRLMPFLENSGRRRKERRRSFWNEDAAEAVWMQAQEI